MLHITTTRKTSHHKKAIVVEIFVAMAMLAVFFVPVSEASDITVDMVIKLANKARTSLNIASLKKNDLLQQAAEEKADDMIRGNYFAHISPQGKSPWHWIEKNDYDYVYAGENLAMNFTTAEEEQSAWMKSPLHRKNILNPKYNETGVAVRHGVIEGKETTVVVQMFGSRKEEKIASANEEEIGSYVAGSETDVAGIESRNSVTTQEISGKMNSSALYNNNASTLIGWGILFSLAIIIIIVDIAAIIHRRHKPFFFFQRETNFK